MLPQRLVRCPAARLITFGGGAFGCIALGVFVAPLLLGALGLAHPILALATSSALIGLFVLGWSYVLLRSQTLGLSALGLPMTRERRHELAVGFAITAGLFVAVAAVQSTWVDALWDFQGVRGIASAIAGLGVTLVMVLAEELLFRGLGLRYLAETWGARSAIILSALLFGGYHLIGSGNWGMGLAFQFIMPTLGGLVFGWAAWRSRGLSLPLGLHWGGNWVQACVAGFVENTPDRVANSLFAIPISAADFRILTAPDLLPRLPLLIAFALAVALTAVAGKTSWAAKTPALDP